MITYLLISLAALVVLLVASDWFIDAAEKIGLSLGISPFIIGVTIVAFGTSLPELATSIACVFSGSSEIVAGNVIGSNITNILLVLGLTAIVGKQIKLNFNIWEIDMPLLFGSAFLLYFAIKDQYLSYIEAIIFLLALVAFLFNSVKGSEISDEERPKVTSLDIVKLLGGGILVYFGAVYTIYGIENIAALADISPELISLTGVALGTSLPEVVVSINAAKRGKHAIAVGNVLGSNLFNTYAVMGIPRLLGDISIQPSILETGMPFMIVATLLFGFMTISQKISKWEGMILIMLYIFYLTEVFNSI